jgi:hypothetical protein
LWITSFKHALTTDWYFHLNISIQQIDAFHLNIALSKKNIICLKIIEPCSHSKPVTLLNFCFRTWLYICGGQIRFEIHTCHISYFFGFSMRKNWATMWKRCKKKFIVQKHWTCNHFNRYFQFYLIRNSTSIIPDLKMWIFRLKKCLKISNG